MNGIVIAVCNDKYDLKAVTLNDLKWSFDPPLKVFPFVKTDKTTWIDTSYIVDECRTLIAFLYTYWITTDKGVDT